MEQKNRLMIVATITVLIIVAMFTSFGRSLFALNTPSVALPDSGAGADDSSGSVSQSGENPYQQVEVTPGTVQNIIATLERPDSYYQELMVETLWEDGSSSIPVQVWRDGGWSHSRQVQPSSVIRHDLVGQDTVYYWYEGSQQYEQAPADEQSSDLAQHIPTYETVLELDPAFITAAGYELREAMSCIYVEVTQTAPDRVERYWVSVDSGLLVSAEQERQGRVVYRMSAYGAVTTPCPDNASFVLPDGTELHSIS